MLRQVSGCTPPMATGLVGAAVVVWYQLALRPSASTARRMAGSISSSPAAAMPGSRLPVVAACSSTSYLAQAPNFLTQRSPAVNSCMSSTTCGR